MKQELKNSLQRTLIALEMEVNAYRNGTSKKDINLNDVSDMMLLMYEELHTECYVGMFVADDCKLRKYDLQLQTEESIHYDFAIPQPDEKLISMLKEYNEKKDMSVTEKTYKLDTIKDRICEVKGLFLYWEDKP